VHGARTQQRPVQIRADVLVSHVLVELGLIHELRRLLARAAQEQRAAARVQRVGTTTNAPVGPPICTREPPSAEMMKPATIAV
jgi:hypothetical protein